MEVGDTKTSKWNYLANKAQTPWILFIEGNEILETSNLSYLRELDSNIWSSCILSVQTNKGIESYYQNRLVPTGIEGIFQGRELPDTSNFIIENNVQFLPQSLDIQSDIIPWEQIDISAERVSLNSPVNLFLYEARKYITEQKFVQAASSYRVALKKDRLLPYDHLAALNG